MEFTARIPALLHGMGHQIWSARIPGQGQYVIPPNSEASGHNSDIAVHRPKQQFAQVPPVLPEQVLVKQFGVCMLNSPSAILRNIHLVFILHGAGPKKGSSKPLSSHTGTRHPLCAATLRALWTL